MNAAPLPDRQTDRPDDERSDYGSSSSNASAVDAVTPLPQQSPDQNHAKSSTQTLIPAFGDGRSLTVAEFRNRFIEACDAWLMRSQSADTRSNYARDLTQFLAFKGIRFGALEQLTSVRPEHIAQWRDHLKEKGLTPSSIRRKLTVLRSLFSYLKTYGYAGANPAHSDFVRPPAVPRDGKTVGLSPEECRRLLDAPDMALPVGIRDRAILAVLAYSACRVGELARLRIKDVRQSGHHTVLEIRGKGGRERRIPLHPEAVERLMAWMEVAARSDDPDAPLFAASLTARGKGCDGFHRRPLSRRAIQAIVKRFLRETGLNPAATVHSLRVTALTTARDKGVDILDLQDFAGHTDPRTTLAYIRSQKRLSNSPAYVLRGQLSVIGGHSRRGASRDPQ